MTWKRARRSAACCSNSDRRPRSRGRRLAALLLAILLLMAVLAPGQSISVSPRISTGAVPRGSAVVAASLVARRLAKEIQKVQSRFDRKKRELPAVQDPSGASTYTREQVLGLIDSTEQDLDRAIKRAGGKDLGPMRAWAAEEFRSLRAEIDGSSTATTALLASPHPVARYASLALPAPELVGEGGGSLAELPGRIDRILEKLFVLAKNDDVWVSLWVGSTPEGGTFLLRYAIKDELSCYGKYDIPGTIRIARGRYEYFAILGKKRRGVIISCKAAISGAIDKDPDAITDELDFVRNPTKPFLCCRSAERQCLYVDDQKCTTSGR